MSVRSNPIAMVFCTLLSSFAHAEVVNPTVAYDVPPASFIFVNPMFPTTISIRGLGAEETGVTRLENCNYGTNAANFTALPAQYTLTVTQTTGAITVLCTNASNSVTAILSCMESANPGNNESPIERAWLIRCSNVANESATRMAYAPNVGTTLRASGAPLAGSSAQVNLEVRFVPGFLSPPSGSLTACQFNGANAADFSPLPPDTVLSQSSVNFPLQCVRGTQAKAAELQCQETIGSASVTRSWPLLCPAGEVPLFFNGFESKF